MKKIFNKRNAITLLSLTITIAVLIILSAVVLNIIIGNDGFVTRAKLIKEEYLNAQEHEQEKINGLKDRFASGTSNNNSLPDNTNEIEAGTKVKIPSSWLYKTVDYYINENGIKVASTTKVATVYAVSDGSGNTIPIPKGFYYVGGDLETGVVISDAEADAFEHHKIMDQTNTHPVGWTDHANRKNLQGNQFVWIPCDIDDYNYVTTYGENSSANYGNFYVAGEIAQIEKYGGYYVGRYEAGICMPTGTNNSGITTANILDGTNASAWISDEFATTTGKPVVRAGAIPWYHANYSTATNVAQNMYKGNSYVTSGILTGIMWDQMIAKIGDGNTNTSGNYSNSSYTSEVGVYHTSANSSGTEGWTSTSVQKNSGSTWIVESGMLDTYARYNIYDTAGNLWEWVEQNASDSSKNVVTTLRGGSFYNNASPYSASYRGYGSTANGDTHYGFRVALYIK